jgi:hypothetical protein
LKIVNKFIFNRNKKETIILIHGLYTTSGFWLSYLNLFKNFRIIAFDINYDTLLTCESSIESLKADFDFDGQVVGIISHSFGTIISDLVFENKIDIFHKICPVAFSKRIDSSNFVLDIINKTGLSENSIFNNIKLVNSFMSKIRNQITFNGQFYIPKSDCYFSYDVSKNDNIEFIGDHFNIDNALLLIIEKLKSVN